MDLTHMHLILNHVPVTGVVFGFLLLAYALARKSQDLKQASFWTFVVTALFAVAAYFTGEPAEETVEHLAGVSEIAIESHEEAALLAMLGAAALGVIALAGLRTLPRSKTIGKAFTAAVLVGSLLVSGMMAWTANLGGQIRHTEIRAAAPTPGEEGAAGASKAGRKSEEHQAKEDN